MPRVQATEDTRAGEYGTRGDEDGEPEDTGTRAGEYGTRGGEDGEPGRGTCRGHPLQGGGHLQEGGGPGTVS